jgi:uncharacterized protein (DUF1499 family)
MFKKISLLMATSMVLAGFSAAKADVLGVKDGQLARCPSSPNCVSTQATDSKHSIEPMRYTSAQDAAMRKLIAVINSMPRTKIVKTSDDYLHAEFSSAVFRFVDDVEFLFNESDKTIQFRSASRVGHSDFGVNRKRMEDIRQRFMAM